MYSVKFAAKINNKKLLEKQNLLQGNKTFFMLNSAERDEI